ncbi:MAG: hypothetical protein NVV59_17850 [Chitinophagaceae bacterium]|nr:hypothetical protein [Chitinophagaceae bacterium]
MNKIHKLESEIVTIDNTVEGKEKDIIGYENGIIPLNIPSLKGSVGEFMGGWQNYTYGNFSHQKAKHLIDDSIALQNRWLENKIVGLKTDTK